MTSLTEAAAGRRLVRSVESGVLSTMSRELPGYPFGSVTPYATTHEGEIVIYVSSIAQHTRNMGADPRVSLTVAERGRGNAQALGRATVLGDACAVPGEATDRVAQRYFRLFPEAQAYAGTHDFAFWWIVPKRVRFIGGFGQIYWIEAEAWTLPTPAWAAEEQGVIDHMNRDHGDALRRIVSRVRSVATDRAEVDPVLVAVDPEGIHVRAGDDVVYAEFLAPAYDSESLRAATIELAQREA